MKRVFVGQSCLRLTLRTGIDLSDIDDLCMRYIKPNGFKGSFKAFKVGNPIEGVLAYECAPGDLDIAGWWKIWSFFTFSEMMKES